MDLLADLMEMEGGVPDLGALNGLPADVLHVIQGHLQECAILRWRMFSWITAVWSTWKNHARQLPLFGTCSALHARTKVDSRI